MMRVMGDMGDLMPNQQNMGSRSSEERFMSWKRGAL